MPCHVVLARREMNAAMIEFEPFQLRCTYVTVHTKYSTLLCLIISRKKAKIPLKLEAAKSGHSMWCNSAMVAIRRSICRLACQPLLQS